MRDSGNPYANIDCSDDEPQPYVARGDVMPWEKSPSIRSRHPSNDGSIPHSPPISLESARARDHSSQDPYAAIDPEVAERLGDGGLLHRSEQPIACVQQGKRKSDKEIEGIARELQLELWNRRFELWDGNPPTNPIDILDIEKALGLVGFRFELRDTLGRFSQDGKQIEVAGLFDPAAKTVYGSQQFDLGPSMNFTFAHELGHAVLHRDLGTLHRDRLKDGTYRSHEPQELEADKFATFFLMPSKLVMKRFNEAFRMERFELTDDTVKGLVTVTSTVEKFAKGKRGAELRRLVARELANAERYNGLHFKSLRSQFNVSTEAMAIRLEELSLIDS